MVALLTDHSAGDTLPVTGILEESAEKAAPYPKNQRGEAAEAQTDPVTAQENNITFAASNHGEMESEAVEVFMAIYDQLSDEAKSEVAQILAGIAFEEETLS
jgi:hypothetical protein